MLSVEGMAQATDGFLVMVAMTDDGGPITSVPMTLQPVRADGTMSAGAAVDLGTPVTSIRNMAASGPAGEFAIATVDSSTQVRVQRYTEAGTTIGAAIRMNAFPSSPTSVPRCCPVVAYGAGRFWVAWVDDRNAAPEIYVNYATCAY